MRGILFIKEGLLAVVQAESLYIAGEAEKLNDYVDGCLDENNGELPDEHSCWKDWRVLRAECLSVLMQFRHDFRYKGALKEQADVAIAILRNGLVVDG